MVLHHSHDEQPFYVLVAGCLKKNSAPIFGKDHGCKMKWSTCKDLLLFLRSIMDAEGNGVPANLCMVFSRMLHAE